MKTKASQLPARYKTFLVKNVETGEMFVMDAEYQEDATVKLAAYLDCNCKKINKNFCFNQVTKI